MVVLGDLMTDVIARVDDPLALGSDTAARVRTRQGGAGGNVAAWLAASGLDVRFVGRVGDDPFGREAVDVLRAAGVRTHVAVDPRAATGACVVLVGRDGERTMLPDAGANSMLDVRDLPVADLRDAAHVHVSGYTLMNPGSRAAGLAALGLARDAGVPTSVDAASAAPLQALGPGVFTDLTDGVGLLFATLDEAEVLCGSRDPDVAAARLTEHHPQVVLKLGARGAWWCPQDGRATVRVPAAAPRPVVDAIGAGDAFAAAVVAGLVRGEDPGTALRAGCERGAEVVGREGARP